MDIPSSWYPLHIRLYAANHVYRDLFDSKDYDAAYDYLSYAVNIFNLLG